MEEALSLLDTSKLVQGKVSKAGDHVLKSAWQVCILACCTQHAICSCLSLCTSWHI